MRYIFHSLIISALIIIISDTAKMSSAAQARSGYYTHLKSLNELKTSFNEDAGAVRIILLMSPT